MRPDRSRPLTPEHRVRLLEEAVADADRAARGAAVRLWTWFGLPSSPPAWEAGERAAAGAALAAVLDRPGDRLAASRVRDGLRRLTASSWAASLADELSRADEQLWKRVLEERYETVRRCCAPRTYWRTRTLSELLGDDAQARSALESRLQRWMAESWDYGALPGELEAAFVRGRVPPRHA